CQKNPSRNAGVFLFYPENLAAPLSLFYQVTKGKAESLMPTTLLILLLIALPTSLLADDLSRLLPEAATRQVLTQLQDNTQPRFAVVDYARRSSEPRLMLFDRRSHKLLASYRVAHGQGSDRDHDGYAERFSDAADSHASSLGTFRTGASYLSPTPGHGLSMRLQGLSVSNRNAEQRAIVLHGNFYMEADFIQRHGVAGRSHGCLVLANADRDKVIDALQSGSLLFAIDSRQTAQDYLRTMTQ
ncbi:MAG TPA: murein L,D-transpeptidase catalytic domain family protein, partial [Pseudomonas sp.]|nr:murein L,D-transpeptidase catalytic domain family protein [Pseudomonas sp.]